MTIIHGLYQSDHNPHEHELLVLHQVRSFKRKTKKEQRKFPATGLHQTEKLARNSVIVLPNGYLRSTWFDITCVRYILLSFYGEDTSCVLRKNFIKCPLVHYKIKVILNLLHVHFQDGRIFLVKTRQS